MQLTFAATGAAPLLQTDLSLHPALLVEPSGLKGPPVAVLDQRSQVTSLFAADPNKANLLWRGPQDLSAKLWLGTTPTAMLFRADVTDDVFRQMYSGADVWKGDGIQLAFDVPGQKGYWEVGLTRLENGSPQVWLWQRPTGTKTDAKAVTLKVGRQGHSTTYEAAFPFAAFGLSRHILAQGIRLSALINDDDGGGRESWIALSGGIGRRKDPTLFPLVVFPQR